MPVPATRPATAPMQIGMAVLNVRDLARVSDYYRRLLGLDILSTEGTTQRLGVGATPLLELRGNPGFAPRSPQSAGLFHTAFLMPDRPALARWLRYVAANRLAVQGASDHLVSEAIYLGDPEGNGIEVYVDRPRAEWPNVNGMIEMASDPLDIEDLMAVEPATSWTGAPEGLIIGHMHLQVGRLTEAEAFYSGVLGMAVPCRYPGAIFYGAGGYHHQIASNMWNSRGAGPIDPKTTGLVGFDIILDTTAQLETIAGKAAQATNGNSLTLNDPWTLALSFTTREER